jgi:hypothetical protein
LTFLSKKRFAIGANQVYIGNLLPDALAAIAKPWYENPVAERGKIQGKFGEIMPLDELLWAVEGRRRYLIWCLLGRRISRRQVKKQVGRSSGDCRTCKTYAKLDRGSRRY